MLAPVFTDDSDPTISPDQRSGDCACPGRVNRTASRPLRIHPNALSSATLNAGKCVLTFIANDHDPVYIIVIAIHHTPGKPGAPNP
ncbi:MAG: hypothetical protein OXL41_09085 [Nitrospinae bacterium]|nr:hypothetical protein [Nitrospinota bacterium]